VDPNKIAMRAVKKEHIQDRAVGREKIEDSAVDANKIADASILFSDIAQNSAAAGQVMKWNGTYWVASNDLVSSVPDIPFIAGDFVVCYNDQTRINLSPTFVKIKETKIARRGTLRIKFALQSGTDLKTVFAQIRRNGMPVGITHSTNSTTTLYITEDITGWSVGDLVQIWGYSSQPPNFLAVSGFGLCADNPAEAGANSLY
jgi:hypothetical protein